MWSLVITSGNMRWLVIMFSSYFISNNFKNGKIPAQAGHRFGQLTQIVLVMIILLDHQIVDDLILTLNLQII